MLTEAQASILQKSLVEPRARRFNIHHDISI
jgi:hypothetical protein